MSGWIKVPRAFLKGPLWSEKRKYGRGEAWIDFLGLAVWQPIVRSSHEFGVDRLERGEVLASASFLAERWSWRRSAVQRWTDRCRKEGWLAGPRPGRHGNIYSIVNYDDYDAADAESGHPIGLPIGQVAGRSRAGRGHKVRSHRKQENTHGVSLPSRPVLSPTFETAWIAYPSRLGSNPKAKALGAWRARVGEGVREADMLAGVLRYADHIAAIGKANTEFVMQAVRFFGPGREWEGFQSNGSATERRDAGGRPLVGLSMAEAMAAEERQLLRPTLNGVATA